ncbi:MAG: hypothetical protein JKX85_14780 [Phycisphaeraceae bacterium]|nr:hypothetical protein [Phycisphaeraceae bacterium]
MQHGIKNRIMTLAILLVMIFITVDAQALSLPNIFASHMVLQRDLPIQVWGTAKAHSMIRVTFADQSVNAKANDNGKWKLSLKALPANSKAQKMTVTGDGQTITYDNVLIGYVWICSGQSNMGMRVKSSNNSAKEIANATDNLIRLCRVKNQLSPTPQTNLNLTWYVCNPKNVPDFSAAGYFFGRTLRQNIDVPVGLIDTSWGGTPAEAWTRKQTLTSTPLLSDITPRWDKKVANYPQRMAKWQKDIRTYQTRITQWLKDHPGKTKKDARSNPKYRSPRKPRTPDNDSHAPAVLYNAMIYPLAPFGIKGAIWYQGESNAGRSNQYRTLLPAMIKDWRDLWSQGDFPFGIVQLANFHPTSKIPQNSGWAHLRDAQCFTHQSVTNTGLAVIIDIGDAKNIHPKNKQDVGKRLALWAMHDVYNLTDTQYTGPVYSNFKVTGSKVTLTFDHVDGQLTTTNGKAPAEFIICGKDQKWVWAKANITGKNTLEVWANEIAEPVAVRYAWANNPATPNLTDASKLPASPFSTHNWPK